MRQTERRESVSVGIPPPAHEGNERPAPGPDDHDVEGIPRRLEVRPVGAARQLFQRAPQSLVVHILDADLLPQRREVALLMPQLDPGDVGDPLELQDALGVDQQHAEVLHPFVELRVDEAFHRRAWGDEGGHLVRVEVAGHAGVGVAAEGEDGSSRPPPGARSRSDRAPPARRSRPDPPRSRCVPTRAGSRPPPGGRRTPPRFPRR